jgi:thiol-disulfide isomerase/thioredoxin
MFVACSSDPAAMASDLRTSPSVAVDGEHSTTVPETKVVEPPPGAELVGTEAPEWELGAWHNSEAMTLAELRGRVVMVRFWTNTCPYCRASLPAIEALAQEFKGEPVTFVGLYHAKPEERPAAWSEAVAAAREFGVTFPIAHDEEWKTLRNWWLNDQAREATSSSFVIDARGRIVFVHAGPVFFPSDDPRQARENEDYEAVKGAIVEAIARVGS